MGHDRFPQQPSFVYPAISGTLDGGSNKTTSGGTVHSYQVQYYNDGSVEGYTDSAMGTWGFTYDALSRLAQAATNQSGNPTPNYCWSYDGFGNRLVQETSSAAFQPGSGGAIACQGSPSSIVATNVNAKNQVTSTNARGVTSLPDIDAAGDITSDGANWYLYDAEGRVCAVASTPVPGMLTMTGYVYNAEGMRVSKGSITSWSCNPATNGFSTINDYEIAVASPMRSLFIRSGRPMRGAV